MKRTLGTIAATLALAAYLVPSAAADSENCMSLAEYDRLEWGMSRIQVYNIADIYGKYLGDTPDGGEFKVGYRACWDDDRRAVLGYSYDTSRLEWWDVRDRPS